MPRKGFWTDRSAVYVVQVCEGFKPISPWNNPDGFSEGMLLSKNVTLEDARATVRAMNKRAIEVRAMNPAAWDRKWAIAVACVRAAHIDGLIHVPSGIGRKARVPA